MSKRGWGSLTVAQIEELHALNSDGLTKRYSNHKEFLRISGWPDTAENFHTWLEMAVTATESTAGNA